jgi:hypothetical protein
MSKTPDVKTHEPNLRAIIKELGLKPIEPAEFLRLMQEYIDANQPQ